MSMKRFWENVGRRSRCGNCSHGNGDWKVTLQRSHNESRGYFTCPGCGARGVYLRRGPTQDDATRGALRTAGVDHEAGPVPGSPDDS